MCASLDGDVPEPGVDISHLSDERQQVEINRNKARTYAIVYGLQDFVVEVTTSVRVPDRKGESHGLEPVPRVGNVGDQEVGTLVSDGAIRIVPTAIFSEPAACDKKPRVISDVPQIHRGPQVTYLSMN